MDLLSFIQTANLMKVKVAESHVWKMNPSFWRLPSGVLFRSYRLLLLVLRVSWNLALTSFLMRGLVGMVKASKKKKICCCDAGGPSHPPKKLREDYGALGGAFAAGKSRFVISSDSSHHSGANIAEAEVDSIVRSSALAIATVTTVTVVVDADTTADRVPVEPSLFGVSYRICREMLDEFPPSKFFAYVRGMDHDQLFIEFNVGAARQISLSAEAEAVETIRLRAEVFKFEASEKSLQGEVGVLRDHSATLEREKNGLSVKVTDLSASVKVREQEFADLDAQVIAVKLQNDNLVDQVHKLEISSTGLQEKVAAYKDFIGQLEKFQDEKMEEVNEKFDKLWAAISKAVEEGMQEGLSARITHGAKGRKLAYVAAYNLSAEADYLSALQRLQNVNFSLIVELKSNKDATDGSYPPFSGSTRHLCFRFIPFLGCFSLRVRKIRENIASHVSALRGVFVPLSEPLFVADLEGTIPPISTDDYEVAHVDDQEGASVDGETAAVENINPFSNVSNAELNILE
nr:hypothetical protein [Tanacetum cinerariifolium]